MSERNPVLLKATFNPRIKQYIFYYSALILFVTIIGIPFLIIWLAGFGQWVSRRFFDSLVCELRAKHLVFKKGPFFKVEKTIPLENIQDLAFIQNPILNAFGLQILKIETAGHSNPHGSDMQLIGINDLEKFKDAVLEQRSVIQDAKIELSAGNESKNLESREILLEIKNLLEQIRDQKGM
jgi:putative membrane protein